MKNLTMGKIPAEFADNYIEEKIDTSIVSKNKFENVSYEDLKKQLLSLLENVEESYNSKSRKEIYDLLITLKMAKSITNKL